MKRMLGSVIMLLISSSLALGRPAKEPRVSIVQQKTGEYQMLVEGKPYIVHGVGYSPIPIGKNYEYNFWNDPGKPWINVDGPLMKELGVNTIRVYQEGESPEQTRQLMRDLYEEFGIRTIMTHYLGFWAYPVANYADEEFQKRTIKDVERMVKEYKDEPGVLMWCLGNENNFSFGPQKVNPWTTKEIEALSDPYKKRIAKAKIYYQFIEKVAKAVKKIDTDHPIMMGNGDLADIEIAKRYCPHVEVLGSTVYRGKSFGNLFKEVEIKWGKPIIFSEFGCDSYDAAKQKEDQDIQAAFIKNQWAEIACNFPGNKEGVGNCLGGCIFEWNDEWWKAAEANTDSFIIHDTSGQWCHGSYYYDIKAPEGMNMNEEWWGIVSLDPEQDILGNNKRIPKKAYYLLQEIWLKEEATDK
ncbi:MAG: hypothetical protein HY920_02450 [Elusimicrobia bacterium]|nr:hypothetical protein [Elusimicrobiota bacterium]